MSRLGPRVKLAPNVYQDGSGISAQVCVNRQRQEARFPLGTALLEIQRWQSRMVAKLERTHGPSLRGTLGRDRLRYERQIGYLAPETQESRRAELNAWQHALGAEIPRARITPEKIRHAVGGWFEQGVAPKTINNRLDTLRHLYHLLDGRHAWTPVDEVDRLEVPKRPAVVIAPAVINLVLANLEAQEQSGRLRDAKTRARFMVRAATGKRPAEIMRAQPGDVDRDRRVWVIRDAKGGETPGGLYLNEEMLAAWDLFFAADAWGWFDTSSFAKVIRHAGFPEHVAPYQMRHSTWITASERGIDLADIQAGAGHKQMRTTRRHYVPVLDSRMQRLSETLDGRFGWTRGSEAVPQPVPQPVPQRAAEPRKNANVLQGRNARRRTANRGEAGRISGGK